MNKVDSNPHKVIRAVLPAGQEHGTNQIQGSQNGAAVRILLPLPKNLKVRDDLEVFL